MNLEMLNVVNQHVFYTKKTKQLTLKPIVITLFTLFMTFNLFNLVSCGESYYDLLGISRDADNREIRKSF